MPRAHSPGGRHSLSLSSLSLPAQPSLIHSRTVPARSPGPPRGGVLPLLAEPGQLDSPASAATSVSPGLRAAEARHTCVFMCVHTYVHTSDLSTGHGLASHRGFGLGFAISLSAALCPGRREKSVGAARRPDGTPPRRHGCPRGPRSTRLSPCALRAPTRDGAPQGQPLRAGWDGVHPEWARVPHSPHNHSERLGELHFLQPRGTGRVSRKGTHQATVSR